MVIKATIKAFNDAHEVVCDIFSCGVASKLALEHRMKTIAVVCNSQEQREIEAACWRAHERANPPTSAQEVPLETFNTKFNIDKKNIVCFDLKSF